MLWTKEDDDFLKEWYNPSEAKHCAEVLDRTKSAIQHRASRLGLTSSDRWTSEEDKILLDNYSDKGLEYCASLISSRTKVAVENRVAKLSLKRNTTWTKRDLEYLDKYYNDFTIKELAEKLNRSEASIMRQGTKRGASTRVPVTKKELIEELQEFKPKSRRDCDKLLGTHSGDTYSRVFGSWNNALVAAGLPLHSNSSGEVELCDFISSIYSGTIIRNDREILGGLELDVTLPELKIAFEYNGVYWHSSAHKKSSYHIDKTVAAHRAGYKLIHIYESDWLNKTNIVQSRVSNLIGESSSRVYARNCTIKELTTIESREFFDTNHLQGFVGSSFKIGLFIDNELKAAMLFGKPRYNSNIQWELLRFANLLNTNVVGGASKLFKAFLRTVKPSSVLSYSLLDWGYNSFYEKLGFQEHHVTKPSYSYVVGTRLESRIKYQKHKLAAILNTFDESKTEEQNMLDNGFYRLYNCGNQVFLWAK